MNTGSSGQAQVTVQAGGTAGAVTVVASCFRVHPDVQPHGLASGTDVDGAGFYNAADFQRGSLSPCSLATIIAPGLAPGLQGMVVGSALRTAAVRARER